MGHHGSYTAISGSCSYLIREWFLHREWPTYCISTSSAAENIAIIDGRTTAALLNDDGGGGEGAATAVVQTRGDMFETLKSVSLNPAPESLFCILSIVLRLAIVAYCVPAAWARDLASVDSYIFRLIATVEPARRATAATVLVEEAPLT